MALKAALTAIAGAIAVAAGVTWIYPPAGVICAGVETVCGAYVYAYLKVRAR